MYTGRTQWRVKERTLHGERGVISMKFVWSMHVPGFYLFIYLFIHSFIHSFICCLYPTNNPQDERYILTDELNVM